MRSIIRKFFPRLFFRLFYMGTPPWDSGITPPELEEFIQNHPPGRVIDLGCGTGTNVITLAHHGWQVSGVDFVPKAIHHARRKARLSGVDADFHVGDVTDPKFFHGDYDLILDIGCYHVLTPEQRQKYRDNLRQHLATSRHIPALHLHRPGSRRHPLHTQRPGSPSAAFLSPATRR